MGQLAIEPVRKMTAMSDPTVTRTRTRPSLAAEDLDLAKQVGSRLKAARTRAGLTQRALAEPRYTKAYISALENGLIKPSMAALRFLARRLGTVPSEFLADEDTHWQRVDAELRLATGDWEAATDRFAAIIDGGVAGVARGRALLGLAEASYRLGKYRDAIGFAAEAGELLHAAGRPAEERRARYWLAAGHSNSDPARARILLEELLQTVDSGEPELRVRVLVALAAVTSHLGEATAAIGLLEEARRIGVDLDDRRRATLLSSLAQSYRLSGDLEGAVRTGTESLALYRAIDARGEIASVENELAMTYLGLGNLDAATNHARAAREQMERAGDRYWLAHVTDTEAQITLAQGDLDKAASQADAGVQLATEIANPKALVDALRTTARIARRRGDRDTAAAALARAEEAALEGPPLRLRQVLTERSELAAEAGDHATAYELSRRALALG
jgi:transcriptional regulator with XRE-family HTH domain